MTVPGGTKPDIRSIGGGESFTFSCAPDCACFTECCRMLDLALSPYDVLRLKRALAIPAAEFLDRHVVIEDEGGAFPSVYLAMVDDGRASCPFVSEKGCTVYQDRPAACRFYPIGRGTTFTAGGCREQFVLVREDHCLGHGRQPAQNIAGWQEGQGLAPYVRAGDRWAGLLQHPAKGKDFQMDAEQRQRYLSLYDLDDLRRMLRNDVQSLVGFAASAQDDDETLLDAAVDWLAASFFPHPQE